MSSSSTSTWSRHPRRQVSRDWIGLAVVAGLAASAGCGNGKQNPPPPQPDGSMQVVITDGSVKISPELDECPALIATASPVTTHVGGKVTISARASAGQPGAQFTYHWSAGAGTLADANAAATSFTCPGADHAGPVTVTVTVTDGKCTLNRDVTISCFANADAGTGIADAGTDAPATDAAGAGGAGGAGGSGASGSGAGGAAGNGAGGPTGGASGNCVGDPSLCEGVLCNQCTFGVGPQEDDLCSGTMSGCESCYAGTDGCAGLDSDAARTKCYALYTCMRESHCLGDQSAIPCWCGSVEFGKCSDGTSPANGTCLQEFIAAAGNADPVFINQHFIDPLLPVGRAVNLATCRANFCGKLTDPDHPSCPAW